MSGSTVGGVLGAVVGFYFGNPQLGWMIGSAIGGYVDPDVIEGPRLKDAQGITASEGMPRPFGYGTFVCGGNIIQAGPLNEHVKKKRGKGGPVQKTYTYTRTYAIRICEGPIVGIARIWRNNKLVYSTIDGDQIPTETRIFFSKIAIYLGGETQLPDPSLEALPAECGGGVGNVPSYRGTCYMVITEDDLTDMQGAIPQYRFEIAAAGESPSETLTLPLTTTNSTASWMGASATLVKDIPITLGKLARITATATPTPGYTSDIVAQVLVGDSVIFDSGTLNPSGSRTEHSAIVTLPGEVNDAIARFTRPPEDEAELFIISLVGETPGVGETITVGYTPIPDIAGGVVFSETGQVRSLSPITKTTVVPGMSTCAEIVSDLCARVGIPATSIQTTALTQSVRGFMVGKQMEAGAAIRALQHGFFFDFPEFDAKLRGILRGEASVMDVPEDHFIYSDEDKDETVRGQSMEFPRKVNLVAPDPAANYEPAKQTATRRTSDKRAVTEMTAEVPIVFTRDENARVADKMLKVAWDEATGRRTIHLPDQYAALVASDCITVTGRRWRIDKRDEADGVLTLDMVRDRASSYASNATGTVGVDPTAPVSSVRGPTLFNIIQIPPLREVDGVGVYVGGAGVFPGWVGYDLELSYDGGLTFTSVATVTDAATMGGLLAEAVGEPLQVKMQSGVLDSATPAQIDAGGNGIAIGGKEIAQFATSTLVAANEYDLTDVSRGLNETPALAHPIGTPVVLLDSSIRFIPIDRKFIGQTLIFRPVSIGTAPENNPAYPFVYDPVIVVPPEQQQLTPIFNADGAAMTLDDGTILYGRLT